jgi:hypothetical protein
MEPIVFQLDGKDSSPAEIEDALRLLSRELSEASDLDVEQHSEPAPPGTKSATGLLLGLAVKLLDTRAAGNAVVVLKDFLSRHRHLKIKVKRGDAEYEISGASAQELEVLLPQLAALGR